MGEDLTRHRHQFQKKSTQVGKGLPSHFTPIVNMRKDERALKQRNLTPSEFSAFSASLNLAEFKFDEDEESSSAKGGDKKNKGEGESMDVTALDRYNDEVRRYRKVLIDECRNLPTKFTEETNFTLLADAIQKLCRNAYFGTAKAQKLAQGAVPLLIWLVNRKFFPESLTIHLLKSISEMCWASLGLKSKFHKSFGTQVLFQHMVQSYKNKRIACWSCYCLAMIATGSPEVIVGARDINGMEEVISEVSFEYYWYDWPVNFGMVLQGIIYGPNSVSPNEELFQF